MPLPGGDRDNAGQSGRFLQRGEKRAMVDILSSPAVALWAVMVGLEMPFLSFCLGLRQSEMHFLFLKTMVLT